MTGRHKRQQLGTTSSIDLNYHIQSELLQNKIFYLPIAEIYFLYLSSLKGFGKKRYQFLTIQGSSYSPPLTIRLRMVVGAFIASPRCICEASFTQIASRTSSNLLAVVSSFCSFAYLASPYPQCLRPHSSKLV